MKLTLSHNDVVSAICQYLGSQGMTAFDPTVVTAEFAFKRGTKELNCELDTEAKAPILVDAPKSSDEPVTTSAPVVQPKETAPVVVAAEPVVAPVETVVTTTAETPVVETAGGGDDDNLFD